MGDILTQLIVFFIEFLFIVAIIAIVAIKIINKHYVPEDEGIEIVNLSREYEQERDELIKLTRDSTLSEEEQKIWAKLDKKEKKAKAKEEKAKLKKLTKHSQSSDDTPLLEKSERERVFVIDFNGDVMATQVENLRKEIDAIINLARPETDEVLLRLESPGGVVNGYGLASSQLLRLKERNIRLTVAIDKVAASGGYMMSCVADHIICAPFAVVGSIGVVAEVVNFHHLLKKNNIEAETYTAGEYKRTVTHLGENTEQAKEKFREELGEIHRLFKNLVSKYRPQLEIDKVATGQAWHGCDALDLKLVDRLGLSDDLILQAVEHKDVFAISYKSKEDKSLLSRISLHVEKSIERLCLKFLNRKITI